MVGADRATLGTDAPFDMGEEEAPRAATHPVTSCGVGFHLKLPENEFLFPQAFGKRQPFQILGRQPAFGLDAKSLEHRDQLARVLSRVPG